MRHSVEIPFNKGYQAKPDHYPRQAKRLGELLKALRERGIRPNLTSIEVNGDSNSEVIGSIADQIGDKIGALWDKQVITFFGDSAGGTFLSAAHRNLGEDELAVPLVIGDGGTLNNLSNALGTVGPNIAAGIVNGEMPYRRVDLKVREATITTFDEHGQKLETQTAPWTCSVGTGKSGEIINEWESRPRTGHPIANVLLSTWSVIKDTIRNQAGDDRAFPINANSITTLRNLGFFKFGPEYNAPDRDGFFHQAFQSKSGLEAVKRISVFSGVGHIAAVNSWLWKNLPDEEAVSRSDFWRLVAEIKPRHITNPIFKIDWRDPFIHLDGYPTDLRKMGLEEGGHAEIELRTTRDSIPVASVYDEAA